MGGPHFGAKPHELGFVPQDLGFDFQAGEPRVWVSDGRLLLFSMSGAQRRAEEGGPWLVMLCVGRVQCVELLVVMNYPR